MTQTARHRFLAGVFALAVLLASFSALAGQAAAIDFPPPQGAVNDFARVIPPQYRASMEALAREVLQKTGVAMVVATFRTTGGADIETFANELYEAWGIGKKGEDKGVLMLVALKERRFRIETGYGVEGVLPDGLLGRIRDQFVLPLFKRGQFGPGFEKGMKAIAAIIAKEAGVKLTGVSAPGPIQTKKQKSIASKGLWLFGLLAVFLLVGRRGRRGGLLPWILLGSMMGGGHSRGGGFGGFGGGFGGFGGGMSGGGGVSGSF